MGKFVDKLKQVKGEVSGKIQKFEIKKDKTFKELVEKVSKLELALNDLIEKISGLKVETEKKDNKTE